MTKMFKRVIGLVMVMVFIFSTYSASVVNANYKGLDTGAIEQEIESRLNKNKRSDVDGYDSYYVDGVYVCTSVYQGVTEYAYNTGEYIAYKQYINGELVKEEKIVNDVIVTTASAAQLDALTEIIKDNNLSEAEKNAKLAEIGYKEIVCNDTVYYQLLPKVSTRSNTCTVGLDELLEKYPELDHEWSDTISFYCPTLGQRKNIIVRDLRTHYTEIDNVTRNLIAGTAVAIAAVSVYANPASLLSWLGLASSVQSLPDDYTVTRPLEARAYHYRYGETYDTTSANAYVTCYSEWGYDYFVVSNQGNGYDWGIKASPQPMDEAYPDEVIAENAAYAYNTALEMFGAWLPW